MSADTAIVLAGGGERVVAWELGVLGGLADAGLEPASAGRIIGTSAGAYAGTLAALGAASPAPAPASGINGGDAGAFAALVSAWSEAATRDLAERRRRIGALALAASTAPEAEFVAATAARLPARNWTAALVVVAVDAERGRRVAFGQRDGVPLAAALAASRAVPGLRPTIRIDGRRYMDGSVGSATNADLAAGARRIVVVTPTPADPPAERLFALWNLALEAELAQLRNHDAELVVIRAGDSDLDAMGPELMSGEHAAAAYAAGRARGRLLQ